MATVDLTVNISSTTEPPRVTVNVVDSLTAGDDYTFANDGRTYLLVVKGNSGNSVLTFVTQQTVNGLAVADPTVQVNRNVTRKIGPFPVSLYGDVVEISGITNETNVGLFVYRE